MAQRLIDANALKLSHCKECALYPDKCMGKDCDWGAIIHINAMPTIDAVPVSEMLKVITELHKAEKERDYWMNKAHSYETTIIRLIESITPKEEAG